MLIWNVGDPNMTALVDWLDVPYASIDAAIAKLEAAAGVKGDWEYDDDFGYRWWGLVGTFKGIVFTVYTSKGGSLHIGTHDHARDSLDRAGLRAALLAIIAA